MNSINRHIDNMKKSAGIVHKTSSELDMVYTYDDLKGYYVRNIADLPYGLRVEPRRDRIVMNRQEFKRTLELACTESLNDMQREITQ